MTTIITVLQFQKMALPFQLTQPCNQKFILLSNNQHLSNTQPKCTSAKQSTPPTPQECTSAINVQTNSSSVTPSSNTHCSQIIPFYDTSFFKY